MIGSSLDTNVVLRVVLKDVPEQAVRSAEFIDRTKCYVADVVVAECVFVLEKVYKLDRRKIATLIVSFLNLETVSFNETLIEKTFDLYSESTILSFVDCYSIVEARLASNSLVTFDRTIIKKHGTTAREP